MGLERFEHGAVVATLDDTARVAARRMRDFHVGCVIITRGVHPVGILTDRDLAMRVVAEGRDPDATKIADIVTYDITTVPRDSGISTAAYLMKTRGVRRLPIVDAEGKVTGVVTADDLMTLFAAEIGDVGAGIRDAVDAPESR